MLDALLRELNETTVTQKVTAPLDQVRAETFLDHNKARDVPEAERILGEFVQKVYDRCIAPGARMPIGTAIGIAKRHLAQEGRRQGKTVNSFLSDSVRGENGALRVALDVVTEGLKNEQIEFFTSDVIDRHCVSDQWPQKVRLCHELAVRFGHLLPDDIRNDPPEKHAASYREILHSLIDVMRETARSYRRL